MRKLKILKERGENTASEQDLRGLGNEPCFRHSHPNSILSIFGPSKSVLEALPPKMVAVQGIRSRDCLHVSYQLASESEHKSGAIHLYSLALSICAQDPGITGMILWEARPFGTLLKNALIGNPSKNSVWEIIDADAPSNSLEEGKLKILAPVTLHLSQAGCSGFSGVANKETAVTLSYAACASLLQDEISACKTASTRKDRNAA